MLLCASWLRWPWPVLLCRHWVLGTGNTTGTFRGGSQDGTAHALKPLACRWGWRVLWVHVFCAPPLFLRGHSALNHQFSFDSFSTSTKLSSLPFKFVAGVLTLHSHKPHFDMFEYKCRLCHSSHCMGPLSIISLCPHSPFPNKFVSCWPDDLQRPKYSSGFAQPAEERNEIS